MQKLQSDHFYPIPGLKSIKELFYTSCKKHADFPYIHWRNKPKEAVITKTYMDCEEDVNSFATYLSGADISASRLAIMGENSYAWIVSYFATLLHLDCVVPLDRMLKSSEIIQLLVRAKVDTFVIDAKFYLDFGQELKNVQTLRNVIIMNAEKLSDKQEIEFTHLLESNKLTTFAMAIENGRSKYKLDSSIIDKETVIDNRKPQVLIFTSGTTANSKGVLLSQYALASDVNSLMGVVNFGVGTRMLSLLPLSHTFENTCTLLCGTQIGAEIYICDGLKYIQENLKEFKISLIVSVPAVFEQMYRRIMLQAKKSNKDTKLLKAIKVSNILRKVGIDLRKFLFKEIMGPLGGELHWAIQGGASLKKEIIDFFDAIGLRICQGYGLTEMAPVVAGCNTGRFVSGTVGRALSNIDIYIDSEDPSTPGEILIKSESVMSGYYEDDEATRAVIDDNGFFHTGDLGIINSKSGCLKITGRLKSMIVLDNGKKVFPEEIEEEIRNKDLSSVKDVFVYAHPAEKGDVILTAKFLIDKKHLNEEELERTIDEINQSLPSFKRIKSYYMTETDFIRTTTLKLKRQKEFEKTLKNLDELGYTLKDIQGKCIESI